METVKITSTRILTERRFYSGMAIAILLSTLLGFSRSFFLKPFFPAHPAPSESIFYVHGVVFTLWIVLFMVQTVFIGRGRIDWHRKIGFLGAILTVVIVVMGIYISLIAGNRPTGFTNVPLPPLRFMAIPLFDMVLFPAFVGMAFAQRQRSQYHKRWMLLATLSLIGAAIARWPIELGILGQMGIVTAIFVTILAIWDFRSLGKLHPVTLWGGLILIISFPLRIMVSGTDWWLYFAQWAVGFIR
jgi:uncharacterized membrane protein YozB (DUF420 family)